MDKLFIVVLQADLEKAGYRSAPLNETEQLWVVLPNQSKVCTIIDEGVRFESDFQEEKHREDIRKIIADTREFTALFNKAPEMDRYGVPGYRKLGEMGNYVLAAKLLRSDRMEFVTWQYSYDRKNVGLGHYIYNYQEAQKDFLQRTGLVPKDLFFDEKETAILHRAAHYAYENDSDLYFDINEKTPHLMEKLNRLAPDVGSEHQSPDCISEEVQSGDIFER